jgi:hypothetical protein
MCAALNASITRLGVGVAPDTYNGLQGYPPSARTNEPGQMAGLPKLGLRWPESAHRWTGTTCRAASLDYSEWNWDKDAGMGAVEPGGRLRFAADRAEQDYDSRCTNGSWSRPCANTQQ